MGDEPQAAPSSLGSAMQRLSRRWKTILLCTVLVTFATAVLSARQPDQYVASASLLFRQTDFDQELLGRSLTSTTDPTREAATNAQLLALPAVSQRVARALGDGYTEAQIANSISVQSGGDSDVVTVKARSEDPEAARTIANTYANEFIAFQRNADRQEILRARALVLHELDLLTPADRDSARGRDLRRAAAQFTSLAALQTGNARLVQPATVPTSPEYPKTRRDVIVGIFAGLALGFAIAVLFDLLDTRVRTREDIEQALAAPTLAEIPLGSRSAPDPAADGPAAAGAAAFDSLRAGLRYLSVEPPLNSIVVTSAAAGEGKTSVSWGLAVAAAQSGQSVLLIEADLRRSPLARLKGLGPSGGVAGIIVDETSLDGAIVEVAVGHDTPQVLHVLPAGGPVPHPVRLLESERMWRLVHEASAEFELVIIDTPPIGVVPDAIPLTQQADGVLVVARAGRSRRGALRVLRDRLEQVNAPVLGVVVNGVSTQVSAYDYR